MPILPTRLYTENELECVTVQPSETHMNSYTEDLTLPRKGINPLKHTSEIILWNA